MKIAIVRGDFLSSWEIPLFAPLLKNNEVTVFVGRYPVYNVQLPKGMKKVSLWSPADLNFGKVSRWKMAILNRLFIDAHILFGLEEKLKGFDVVYTAETFYNFSRQCVVAKQKGYVKKVVMHVGENIPFNNEGIWGRRQLKQIVIAGTDKFVAITDKAREVLIAEGADPKKIVRATLGVDLTHFQPQKVSPHKNIRLLVVSRLIEDKGIREIVRIFKKLQKKYPTLELAVVGVGPLDYLLTGKGIIKLGRVSSLEMPKIYSGSDIFVHYPKGSKTWLEQFGFVLVEAMACGLPVVGLNRGSVAEVVGQGGLVVKASDFEKTLEKLIKNLDERKKLALIALKFARKNYDAKKYAQKLAKIFQTA